ncbi:hypothetical protein ACFQ14_12630 [Pseudahrensia aquimaris]|uniref:Uncharacterized protein n=1 Tax=Pseudahrensia aquimaris TaxID=744461 RepID=A0ABW3FHN6_9HYPH
MNMYYHPDEAERVGQARESFSGRLLTDPQFEEAIAITGIIETEIKHSGTFKEKLTDFAHAFARTQKFDVMKAETTLRDLFKARTGHTMNQMREELMAKEENLPEAVDDRAKDVTRDIRDMIKDGNKMPFHRAYDYQAGVLASEFDITNAGAKRIMTDVFRQNAEGELYDWGKDLEEKYYRPQIEAEKAERQQSQEKPARGRKRTSSRSKTRTRSRQPA